MQSSLQAKVDKTRIQSRIPILEYAILASVSIPYATKALVSRSLIGNPGQRRDVLMQGHLSLGDAVL